MDGPYSSPPGWPIEFWAAPLHGLPQAATMSMILDSSVDRFSNGMKTTRHLVCAVLRALTFWVRALSTRWHGQKAAWRRGSSFQGLALLRRRALPAGFLAAHSGASNRGI